MTADNPRAPRLEGVRACVFDAYGTLFDFASAAARCEAVPEEQRAALTTMWREKQLQSHGCARCRIDTPTFPR